MALFPSRRKQTRHREHTLPALPEPAAQMALAGQIANEIAQAAVMEDKERRRSQNTQRRHRGDLALFAEYLREAGLAVGDLYAEPTAWRGITWGLVQGFREWQIQRGYALGSVNVRLATVRVFALSAAKAGALPASEVTLIRGVDGFRRVEIRNIDKTRARTRVGRKKAQPVWLTEAQANALKKKQPDSPQGRRDALLMCLLLDHGLRCGEVAGLPATAIDLSTRQLVFYREKVDITQRHELTDDTYGAAARYLTEDRFRAPTATTALLLASSKSGELLRGEIRIREKNGKEKLVPLQMRQNAINDRVRELGEAIGIEGLSPHDCRHYWADAAASAGTSLERLRDAGGWNSFDMPDRYKRAAAVANKGVKLKRERASSSTIEKQ